MATTNGKIKVAISQDFLTAFSALPKKIQGKVDEFLCKFYDNPKSPGINYEKLHDCTDRKICSVRIDQTYRGGKDFLFCPRKTMPAIIGADTDE